MAALAEYPELQLFVVDLLSATYQSIRDKAKTQQDTTDRLRTEMNAQQGMIKSLSTEICTEEDTIGSLLIEVKAKQECTGKLHMELATVRGEKEKERQHAILLKAKLADHEKALAKFKQGRCRNCRDPSEPVAS